MVIYKAYPHMLIKHNITNDIFQADKLSNDIMQELAVKYNGEINDSYIKFDNISNEDIINISMNKIKGIQPGLFIIRNNFVHF